MRLSRAPRDAAGAVRACFALAWAMTYTYRFAPLPHAAEPEAERRERYHKAYGPNPRETFEEYEHRIGRIAGLGRDERQANEERAQLYLEIAAKFDEIDAHPTPRRRRQIKRSRDAALAKLERDGAAVLTEPGDTPKRTVELRIYYVSAAGDVCVGVFERSPGAAGRAIDAIRRWPTDVIGAEIAGAARGVGKRPANPRVVEWPSECANPSHPVAGDDAEQPSLLERYGIT